MILLLVSLRATAGFTVAMSAAHEGLEFNVNLSSDQDVSEVTSDATGEAHFIVSED